MLTKTDYTVSHVRHQAARAHHCVELLPLLTAGQDLRPEEFSRGEVGEPELGHNIVTLGALP